MESLKKEWGDNALHEQLHFVAFLWVHNQTLFSLFACSLCSWPAQWLVRILGTDTFTAMTRTRCTKSRAQPLPAQHRTGPSLFLQIQISKTLLSLHHILLSQGQILMLLLLWFNADLPWPLRSHPFLPTLLQFSIHLQQTFHWQFYTNMVHGISHQPSHGTPLGQLTLTMSP